MKHKPADDRFLGMIGPGKLLEWVRSSAPFLFDGDERPAERRLSDLAAPSDGWHAILRGGERLIGASPSSQAAVEDYLALCLAAHHATVGSYVPTDVDSKIRGELWRRVRGETLATRWRLAQAAWRWDPTPVSTRVERTAEGLVSGHDGEWLGVAMGALGAAILAGDALIAEEARTAVAEDLAREARAYAAAENAARHGDDAAVVALIRLAWVVTHNAGDVDQGLSYWTDDPRLAADRHRFAELAHRDPQRYDGVFHRAKAVYQLVASEGHRNYPLREVPQLRRHPSLLLPLGPCHEPWGRTVATCPHLDDEARLAVLVALGNGVARIRGQVGYQRAIAGMAAGLGGVPALVKLARRSPAAMRTLDDPTVRKHLTLTPERFAATLAAPVRKLLP